MPAAEFQPLDTRRIEVKSFNCDKEPITTYLRRYATKNMALNLNGTFVLPFQSEPSPDKLSVAAYYTLAH